MAEALSIPTPVAASARKSHANKLLFWLPLVLFGVLWADLVRMLSYEWEANEQYAYGWFVPFFALYFFWLRWQDRPAPEVRSQKLEVRRRPGVAQDRTAAVQHATSSSSSVFRHSSQRRPRRHSNRLATGRTARRWKSSRPMPAPRLPKRRAMPKCNITLRWRTRI